MRVQNSDRKYEKLISWLLEDNERREVIQIISDYADEELWLIGGFIRNFVWNKLSYRQDNSENCEVDVAYFNKQQISKASEKRIERYLTSKNQKYTWSVKNQARMHIKNGESAYSSISDAISRFPEKASAIAVRFVNGKLELLQPYGLDDLFNFIARPTSWAFPTIRSFYRRMNSKRWRRHWPNVQYFLKPSGKSTLPSNSPRKYGIKKHWGPLRKNIH